MWGEDVAATHTSYMLQTGADCWRNLAEANGAARAASASDAAESAGSLDARFTDRKRERANIVFCRFLKKICQKKNSFFGSLKVKRDELLNGSRGKQPLRLVRDNFAAEDHEGQYVRGDNRWWCVAAGSCLEGRQGCREGREQHQRPTWWRGASSRSRSSSGSSGVRAE